MNPELAHLSVLIDPEASITHQVFQMVIATMSTCGQAQSWARFRSDAPNAFEAGTKSQD